MYQVRNCEKLVLAEFITIFWMSLQADDMILLWLIVLLSSLVLTCMCSFYLVLNFLKNTLFPDADTGFRSVILPLNTMIPRDEYTIKKNQWMTAFDWWHVQKQFRYHSTNEGKQWLLFSSILGQFMNFFYPYWAHHISSGSLKTQAGHVWKWEIAFS